MRKIAATFFFLFPLLLQAQIHSGIEKYDTDSLKLLIPRLQGTELIDIYNKLAVSFAYYDPPQCEKYAGLALSLSQTEGYSQGIGDAERFLGLMHQYAGKYPESVVHFYNALDKYELIRDDYRLAKLYFDFAKLNFYSGNYPETEKYAEKTLEYYQKKNAVGTTVGSIREIARIKSAYGLLYRTTGRSEQAKELYRWYCRLMVTENFEVTDQLVHNQLLARCFDETGMFDSALFYFNRTLDYPEVNNSIKALKMESRRSIGLVYYKMKNYPKAKEYFQVVANGMDKSGFLFHTFLSYLMLGNIYYEEEDISNAKTNFEKARSVSDEMVSNQSYYRYDSLKYTVSYGAELYFPWPEKLIREKIWEFQATINERLFTVSRAGGDLIGAVEYAQLYSRAKDTLHTLQRNRDLIEMQTKYETVRKEQQIEELAKANELKELRLFRSRIILFGLGILVVLVIIIAILLVRQGKISARQRTAILEQKLLRSQMNPHFIFNSMASIQDFILSKDARSAANYLSRFASLIRNILDASLQETVPLKKEIETIGHYLELQKVRLEDKFDFIINISQDLVEDEIRIPALIVQPFVENAIEHGIRHLPGKGFVTVSFDKKGPWLMVVVNDNGVGRANARKYEELSQSKHAGISTTLILERIQILNRKSHRKISLEITDLVDDEGKPAGTKVEIKVPV